MKHVLLAVVLVLSPAWYRSQAQEPETGSGMTRAVGPARQASWAACSCEGDNLDLGPGPQISVRRLLGSRVTNPLNENVGEVADVLLSRRGRLAGIVVHIGGFLGIGGQSVTVTMDKVRIESAARSTASAVMIFDTRDHILKRRKLPGPAGGQ